MITGTGGLGSRITSHPGFDKISFTGSTPTGRSVMAGAAATMARVTLELGGNDAAIVLPDVNVKETAAQLFWAAFANTGQICLATKRLYVHADIYDDMARELADLAAAVTVGDPTHDDDVDLGPVSNLRQYQTVLDLLNDCRDHGYRFLSGGLPDPGTAGYFIQPTLVDNPQTPHASSARSSSGPSCRC